MKVNKQIMIGRLIQNLPFLCYNFSDFKCDIKMVNLDLVKVFET